MLLPDVDDLIEPDHEFAEIAVGVLLFGVPHAQLGLTFEVICALLPVLLDQLLEGGSPLLKD